MDGSTATYWADDVTEVVFHVVTRLPPVLDSAGFPARRASLVAEDLVRRQ
jgi:hypothetical protein